ncbi:MAG: hypothetical protein HY062_15485 [Bacteroidetes bacterium]|nr:hypothetical protein [Bacteroidota bacterium]
MTIKHKIIVVFLTILNVKMVSQTSNIYLTEARLIIASEDKKGKAFEANTEYAYMILNLTNGDFTLNADLSNLKTGDRKLDSVIVSQGQQALSFKGNISENLFLFNQQVNDEKDYNMPGQLILNGVSLPCIAQFDPVNFGEKSESKNYRMDFKLVVDASKIAILGLENKTNKQVVFEIIDGKLNTQL